MLNVFWVYEGDIKCQIFVLTVLCNLYETNLTIETIFFYKIDLSLQFFIRK